MFYALSSYGNINHTGQSVVCYRLLPELPCIIHMYNHVVRCKLMLALYILCTYKRFIQSKIGHKVERAHVQTISIWMVLTNAALLPCIHRSNQHFLPACTLYLTDRLRRPAGKRLPVRRSAWQLYALLRPARTHRGKEAFAFWS